MKIIYQEPELKDVIEGILGKNFHFFATGVASRTILTLRRSPNIIRDLTITVKPHSQKVTGLARKRRRIEKGDRAEGLITHFVQDTPEENEISLTHEVIHLLEPKWSEAQVEKKARALYKEENPSEISV